MERNRINPELEGIKLTKEQQERLEKLEPIDIEDVAKGIQKAGYKATYSGIDRNGIPHFKLTKE